MKQASQLVTDGEFLLGTTDYSTQSVAVIVADNADLGGGTLSLLAKPSSSPAGYPKQNIGFLVAGDQDNFWVGRKMDLYLKLDGSTSPDGVYVYVTELPS